MAGLLVVDGKTGKLLRSINHGRISAAGPMTYMVGGKQYLALHGMEMLTVYALHSGSWSRLQPASDQSASATVPTAPQASSNGSTGVLTNTV